MFTINISVLLALVGLHHTHTLAFTPASINVLNASSKSSTTTQANRKIVASTVLASASDGGSQEHIPWPGNRPKPQGGDMAYLRENITRQMDNYMKIRSAGWPEDACVNDVYVRNPQLNSFWYTGKVARCTGETESNFNPFCTEPILGRLFDQLCFFTTSCKLQQITNINILTHHLLLHQKILCDPFFARFKIDKGTVSLNEAIARQFNLIEEHATRLRPVELGRAFGQCEVYVAPGDTEMQVSNNDPNIRLERMERHVEGCEGVSSLEVGLNLEVVTNKGAGFFVERNDDGMVPPHLIG